MIVAIGYDESDEEVFRCEDPWDFGQQEANELFGVATRVVVDRDGQRQTLTPENPQTVPDMVAVFSEHTAAAKAAILQLKANAWAAMVGAGMSPSDATAAGVQFAIYHAAPVNNFELAGGHPLAAAALLAAITSQASLAAFPWLVGPVLAVFENALGG